MKTMRIYTDHGVYDYDSVTGEVTQCVLDSNGVIFESGRPAFETDPNLSESEVRFEIESRWEENQK